MHAIVLGSAAGGGFPQWNCRCRVCNLAWEGDGRVRRRTQSSVAVSPDGASWVLLNCSPDVREQIAANPALQPRGSGRHTPIDAVVLSNGDIDHVGGLLSLRERSPFTVWSTRLVRAALHDNSIFHVLARDVVRWHDFAPDEPFVPTAGMTVEAFMVPGKIPLYLEKGDPVTDGLSDASVGFAVRGPRQETLVYIPGCAAVTDALRERLVEADTVLFDGTLFTDDEMIRAGVGEKTGRRMGHMPIGGADGSLAAFEDVRVPRRIYVHLNNTNPALIAGSPERQAVEAAGWEVAEDGMELRL